MTRKSVTVDIYTFDELPKNVQDKLIQKDMTFSGGYAACSYDGEKELIVENTKDKLESLGFENAVLMYSGFCSQGDGASFTADINNKIFFTSYIKQVILQEYKDITTSLLDDVIENTSFQISRIVGAGSYYHDNTIECRYISSLDDEDDEEIEEALYAVSEFIELYARKLARHLYKQLEEAYWNCYNDEYVKSCLIEEDKYYSIDGIQYIEF